jgi:hypothetical protein
VLLALELFKGSNFGSENEPHPLSEHNEEGTHCSKDGVSEVKVDGKINHEQCLKNRYLTEPEKFDSQSQFLLEEYK